MTRSVRIYEVKLRNISSVIICVFLIASETPAFAVAVLRREGVTIGGGDGSSFEKAIIVHAAYLPQALFAGFEYVALRYGWFQISNGSIVKYKGKSYKVISYEDHRAMGDPKPKRVLYFDVSEYLPTYSFPPEYPREARDKGLMGKSMRPSKLVQLLATLSRYR